MSLRWRKAKTDVTEMDVPETEGVFFKSLRQVLVNVTDSFFFPAEYGSGDIECLVNHSRVVFMCFLWSGGRVVQARAKSATCQLIIAVLCSCSFCGLVAECFR